MEYLRDIENLEDAISNCHDMVLYPDEGCPDCGRQA